MTLSAVRILTVTDEVGSFLRRNAARNLERDVFKILFIYHFWLNWVFAAVCGLSLVAASQGCSLVAVHRLLIAGAPLAAERGLQGTQAQ